MKKQILMKTLSLILAIVVTVMALPLLVFAEELGMNELVGTVIDEQPASTSVATTTEYTYRDAIGIESYYPTISQSLPGGGTGFVNLSNRNISLVFPLLSTTDSLLPYCVSLVYNSAIAGLPHDSRVTHNAYPETYTPLGFKLNICETILFESSTNTFIYEDSDGTAHVFSQGDVVGVYHDEDGLQLTLKIINNNEIEISDNSKTVKSFSAITSGSAWRLEKITDRVGNAVIFGFSDNKPVSVSLKPNGSTAIQMLSMIYTNDDKLLTVYNPTTLDAAILRYSEEPNGSIGNGDNNYLYHIDYIKCSENANMSTLIGYVAAEHNDGKVNVIAKPYFSVDASGEIGYIYDQIDGKMLFYVQPEDNTLRIAEAADHVGQIIDIIYGDGFADVISAGNDDLLDTVDDTVTRYIFDEQCRTKSVFSTSLDGTVVYGATLGEYQEQENVKNNIKSTTTLGGSPVNYILNGGFEEYFYVSGGMAFDYWTIVGDVDGAVELEFDGNGKYAADFTPEIDAAASVSQVVTLPAGQYTLSFDINCSTMEGVYGTVNVESVTSSTLDLSFDIPRNTTISNGGVREICIDLYRSARQYKWRECSNHH